MNDTPLSSPQSEAASPVVETAFVCDCKEWVRSACQGESFFREHEGKRFCVLHYPDKDKLEAFRVALKRKLDAKNFNFRGVWFPEEVCFGKFEFSADANFSSATFSADAEFSSATFSADADFRDATFSAEADFQGATFSAGAYFQGATFSAEADFRGATFSAEADFYGAKFGWYTDFESATFKSYVLFAGSDRQRSLDEQASLSFQFTHIEKPDRVSFHTLDLKPHWFINCDCRKFEFTNCNWNDNLNQELDGAIEAEEEGISAPHRLLAITFRQLADNAEANHRYHEASNFRYNAFEARRIERFRGFVPWRLDWWYWLATGYGGFVPWRLDWWYWLASGYGERVGRAFVVFVALFALFAFGYGRVGFDQSGKATGAGVIQGAAIQPDTIGKPLGWKEAFVYSFNVSILQKPEPKPLTLAAKVLVSLETVLGPAQAALLALAVRRRFMR